MNKRRAFNFILQSLVIVFLTSCAGNSYVNDRESALLAKEKAYTNNSQVNTSFTLTMGEREFILAERDVKKGNNKSAIGHFKKAKDFYDDAYISSYVFQRNWTKENYQRILSLKEKRLFISDTLKKVYRALSESLINGKLDQNEAENKLINLEKAKVQIDELLNNSDNFLQKALKLSNEYNMFKTKYVTLDAIKETDKAIDILKNTVNVLFPEMNVQEK